MESDNSPAPPTKQLNEMGNFGTSASYFATFELDKDASILDIGARFGSFLNQLHKAGYRDIHGIDTAEDPVRTGRQRYPHLASRLQSYAGYPIPFDDSTFDAITMFDVLEHIPDVGSFLAEVHRVLKPSGIFIFQTPNRVINIPWEIVSQKSWTRWRKYHCSLQTVRSLRTALGRAGFDEVHIHKHAIETEHNIRKVRNTLGRVGPMLLSLVARLPLNLYPNLWGNCRKAHNNGE